MDTAAAPTKDFRLLWIELTGRCNLQCVHCYADSSPRHTVKDELCTADRLALLEAAAQLRCRRVQFIGGEPTLAPALPGLLRCARQLMFEHIEVYTNATRVSASLLECFVECQVEVAFSFYSHDPAVHDAITTHAGSHAATVRTINRMVEAKLPLRAGIVVMDANADDIEATITFLRNLGVTNIGIGRARSVGRGNLAGVDSLDALCGACANGSLAITPTGDIHPCIMARAWRLGTTENTSLADALASEQLTRFREDLRASQEMLRAHDAQLCNPYAPCFPHKGCAPTPCPPNDCIPFAGPRCRPEECAPTIRSTENLLSSPAATGSSRHPHQH